MKKVVLIVMSFMLTGCLGEVGQGVITKNCIKNEKDVNTSIEIKSREGFLESIVITEVYNSDDIDVILNSKMSEQNLYKQLNGIVLDIDDNTFIYSIDVNNTTDLVKERFHISEEQYKQIKYYEENGYTCK